LWTPVAASNVLGAAIVHVFLVLAALAQMFASAAAFALALKL
jgi:acyl dehydratase